jgi:hypothetical protein
MEQTTADDTESGFWKNFKNLGSPICTWNQMPSECMSSSAKISQLVMIDQCNKLPTKQRAYFWLKLQLNHKETWHVNRSVHTTTRPHKIALVHNHTSEEDEQFSNTMLVQTKVWIVIIGNWAWHFFTFQCQVMNRWYIGAMHPLWWISRCCLLHWIQNLQKKKEGSCFYKLQVL